MHVAVIGATGQLGSDIVKACGRAGFSVAPLTRRQFDIRDPYAMERTLASIRPNYVINTAAFHNVELCEQNRFSAYDINTCAVKHLNHLSELFGFRVILISTDYVFSGFRSHTPYRESDITGPVNVYGNSKLEGEYFINSGYIIRTAALYGRGRRSNFVERMLAKARVREPIRVVSDQITTPTSTVDLAGAICQLIEHRPRFGTYHVTNAGQASWFGFAKTICELAGFSEAAANMQPITTKESGATVRRPAYSVLAHDKWIQVGLPELRDWRGALDEYLHN